MSVNPADGPAYWASGPNGSYRNQTLRYENVELSFDESVSLKTVVGLYLTAAIASAGLWMFCVLIPFVLSGFSLDSAATGATVGGFLAFFAFWLILLFTTFSEPVSEWKTLLEDKAAASPSSYAAIYGALARRRIPVSAVPTRIRSDILPEAVSNRLYISSGRYVAYVSVFEYGTSLYIGWTMWRIRPGAVIIGTYLKDIIGGVFGRTGNVAQMLRTERPRAMREAVHSAVREGVETAVQGVEVPIASTFGHEVPIMTMDAPTAPPAAPPLPPTPPADYGPQAPWNS